MTRIQSVYSQAKQSTPDGSFNWWEDGEKQEQNSKNSSIQGYSQFTYRLNSPQKNLMDHSIGKWMEKKQKQNSYSEALAYKDTVSLLTG